MKHCHTPVQMSNFSQKKIGQINWSEIAKTRLNFAQQYQEKLQQPAICLPTATSKYAQIGFPVFCLNRSKLLRHLAQSNIHPTCFDKAWNFISTEQMERFQQSIDLMNSHLLLPLNQKLTEAEIDKIIQTVNSFQN